MPSTSSTVVSSDLPSSTVMTPSRPTLSMAWAMMSPMAVSWLAEHVPTCAISLVSETFLDILASSLQMAATALSMPVRIWLALAPAVTFLSPSSNRASA